MEGSTAVWLGMTLAAPVTLVPEIALLRLLHARKSHWQPVDILFVSLLVAQLCCTALTLAISAAALARHAGLWQSVFLQGNRTTLCSVLICGWAASHTLQAATLTSLAVDRALTVRWPFRYRLSVRRTQIRYHVVVLAIISLLVGAAAFFATWQSNQSSSSNIAREIHQQSADFVYPGTENRSIDAVNNITTTTTTENRTMATIDYNVTGEACAFLPHMFDGRYSLFWLCLHGVLLLISLAALVVVALTTAARYCCTSRSASRRLGSGSDMRTLGTNLSDGSSATLPPCLPPPPPAPRYTPAPVASLRQLTDNNHQHHHHHHQHHQHHHLAVLSPLARSNHNLLALIDKNPHQQQQQQQQQHGLIHQDDDKTTSLAANKYAANHERGGSNRQRHWTVAAVLIVTYSLYHLPLLVSRKNYLF